MKKIITISIFLSIALIFNAFRPQATPVEQIRTAYIADCEAFEKTVAQLKLTASNTPQLDDKGKSLAAKKRF